MSRTDEESPGEFSHIEITIETVATDGTRTRMTRWTCPSVEMGCTPDVRVQLRFAGEPVVIGGEPAKPDPVATEAPEPWKSSNPAEALSALARTIGKAASVRRIDGGWCADLAGVEVKDTSASAILVSAVAFAETRNGAAAKLVNKLRAGWLIIDAQKADRREMACPPIETWAWGAADRDVATDPRVGDRVMLRSLPRVYMVGAVDVGRTLVTVYGRDSSESMWLTTPEWFEVCRTPGAVIEPAEDPPLRDVARRPKVGDRITINEAGERTTYEVQGFPEEGIACWASVDGRPIGSCVVSPARWKEACGEGSGAVIERAPE